MTKDDIIRMAKEAGFGNYTHEAMSMFERFAALVADAEREKAAVICESACWTADIDEWLGMTKRDVSSRSMRECAIAIRNQP